LLVGLLILLSGWIQTTNKVVEIALVETRREKDHDGAHRTLDRTVMINGSPQPGESTSRKGRVVKKLKTIKKYIKKREREGERF
jgi:hypothetical protein